MIEPISSPRFALISGTREDYPEILLEHFFNEKLKGRANWRLEKNDEGLPTLNSITVTSQKNFNALCESVVKYFIPDHQVKEINAESVLDYFDKRNAHPIILPIIFETSWIRSVDKIKTLITKLIDDFWSGITTDKRKILVCIILIYPNLNYSGDIPELKKKYLNLSFVNNYKLKKAIKTMNLFLDRLEKDSNKNIKRIPELEKIKRDKIEKFINKNHPKLKQNEFLKFTQFMEECRDCSKNELSMLEIEQWVISNLVS